MTKTDIKAERDQSTYVIDVKLTGHAFDIKWDTGAAYTVISIGTFGDDYSSEKIERIKAYCESNSKHKGKFISASGDPSYGYPISVSGAVIGGTIHPDFHYYLVIENKRDIALLGFDFIDYCRYSHNPKGDILITEFDEEGYGSLDGAMNNDEVIAFIDSLSDEI